MELRDLDDKEQSCFYQGSRSIAQSTPDQSRNNIKKPVAHGTFGITTEKNNDLLQDTARELMDGNVNQEKKRNGHR